MPALYMEKNVCSELHSFFNQFFEKNISMKFSFNKFFNKG